MKKLLLTSVIIIMVVTFTGCASVISPGNQGLKWRPWSSGLEMDKLYTDGIVWHYPWNNVIEYEVRWTSFPEEIQILTSDDLHMVVNVTAILRPNPAKLAQLELEVGSDYYEHLVRPKFYTITRNVMAKYEHNLLAENSIPIEEEILSQLRERMDEKYVEFDSVVLDHIMYSPLVTQATDRKLVIKQRLEQKEYELGIAEKDAEIQRIQAVGQRDAQKIIDEGLTKKYLQFKAVEAQEMLSRSGNSTFYFVPLGKDGLPVIVDTGGK
ncbi:MAG: prohibitin family protein [Candidatus Marinimicrobia bacterium]|nr:prohibitin family protein [Candidatus Neomarinimicrobiota bacterium]